eukprot:TRINITY_DN112467_c0_g1_i1.p1 TRINITY_DN112467_c0_g1~~TRINITY_DN112467_c0_g1_i1.p1  ORF type:complete len:435 (-),score=39.06 TRINITY_DN112467_c0_g1_i1:153-1457(-)
MSSFRYHPVNKMKMDWAYPEAQPINASMPGNAMDEQDDFVPQAGLRVPPALAPVTANSNNTYTCWICLEDSPKDSELIRPCLCATYVHRKCLDEWRFSGFTPTSYTSCPNCRWQYNIGHTLDHARIDEAKRRYRGQMALSIIKFWVLLVIFLCISAAFWTVFSYLVDRPRNIPVALRITKVSILNRDVLRNKTLSEYMHEERIHYKDNPHLTWDQYTLFGWCLTFISFSIVAHWWKVQEKTRQAHYGSGGTDFRRISARSKHKRPADRCMCRNCCSGSDPCRDCYCYCDGGYGYDPCCYWCWYNPYSSPGMDCSCCAHCCSPCKEGCSDCGCGGGGGGCGDCGNCGNCGDCKCDGAGDAAAVILIILVIVVVLAALLGAIYLLFVGFVYSWKMQAQYLEKLAQEKAAATGAVTVICLETMQSPIGTVPGGFEMT